MSRCWNSLKSIFSLNVYATKKRKIMRNAMSTKKIFIISHRFDDILLRYLASWLCAPSTFANVSSMFWSILIAISPCWETMVASCVKILLSSWIVDSTVCRASARPCIYVSCNGTICCCCCCCCCWLCCNNGEDSPSPGFL